MLKYSNSTSMETAQTCLHLVLPFTLQNKWVKFIYISIVTNVPFNVVNIGLVIACICKIYQTWQPNIWTLQLCVTLRIQERYRSDADNRSTGHEIQPIIGEHVPAMKSSTFWVITLCSPLKLNRRFGGTFRLHLQGRRINRERNQRSFETSVDFQRITLRYIPEYSITTDVRTSNSTNSINVNVTFRSTSWICKGVSGFIAKAMY
jgi:hypothetical protein